MDAPEHISIPDEPSGPGAPRPRLGLDDPVTVHQGGVELTMSCAEALELSGALAAIVRGRLDG